MFIVIFLLSIILADCTGIGSDTIRPDTIAQQVGAHYGDPHAKVSGDVRNDVTDNPPHDPMYIMTIVGNFHKNGKIAHSISFSARADKMYVWNIHAYDQQGKEVWWDVDFTHDSPVPEH